MHESGNLPGPGGNTGGTTGGTTGGITGGITGGTTGTIIWNSKPWSFSRAEQ